MDYPFANGVISALETKILDKNKLFVLNKYEKDEFVKVLLSMNYGGVGKTVEELILAENAKVRETINGITPSKKDTNLFYLLNDAQNIKVLYKIKTYNINKEDLLNNEGTISPQVLINAIINDNFELASKELKLLVQSINKEIKKIDSPKLLSATIDNEIYQYALRTTKDKILIKYIKAKIDFTNVISMYRVNNLGWKKEDFLTMFVDGGTISKDDFNKIFDLNKEEQIKYLLKFYDEKISKILVKSTSINTYQLEFDRLLIEIMGETKNDPFNIGPMINYYLLKQAEAQNIRILYSLNDVQLKDLI